MKSSRFVLTLLVLATLTACSADLPTGPAVDAEGTDPAMGQGLLGGDS
jgi:outer membrane biogenesis lipoprotein LolB